METVKELRRRKWANHKENLNNWHEAEHFVVCMLIIAAWLIVML